MCKTFGIDISSWQGDIDLAAVAPGFVILRAGYGKNTVDSCAVRNMNECERLGIPYGVYWYSYALSEADARAEARRCLDAIKGRKISVGVWYDMEDADGYKSRNGALRPDLTSAMCRAFCEIVEAAGYHVGVYTSLSWYQDGYVSGCDRYDRWIAWWGRNDGNLTTDPSGSCSLHQYAGDVWHKGIKLDLDVCYTPLSHFTSPAVNQDGSDNPATEPAADTPTTPCWPPRMLCLGMVGSDVMMLQAHLYAHKYDPGSVCGVFDEATLEAVLSFQEDRALKKDGVVGDKTWTALGVIV